ncbi:MAG: HEAT repeat domain-containing protein [Chloroflexi bacterium]|nr:HEAT repeat domain-containing protein [Chloroflexota bacterium]
MSEEMQQPFSTVLDALFADDPLPIEALYRLSDLSDDDFAEFRGRWSDVPDERRRVIMRHLADITEENFVVDFGPIFAYSLTDSHAPVRQTALDGIWDATDTTLINPIIAIMQTDENEEAQAAAAAALAHYVLLAEWRQLPAHISPPIVAVLLAEYEKGETAVSVKRAALEALASANHPRVAGLIEEAYESDNFEMQLSAVFAMGGSADKRWLPIVFDEMENPVEEMRAEAARAAGSIGGSDAVEALANLTVDDELSVAAMAVDALGQIGGARAQKILEELLGDPESEALREAIEETLEELVLLGGDLEFDWLDVGDE